MHFLYYSKYNGKHNKMSRLPFFFAISLLTSCTDTVPKANLEFVKVEDGKNYPELIFRSSENLASAFKDKKTRRPIFGELFCSLSGDENLKFDHHLDFFANGSLDEIRQALGANKILSRHRCSFGALQRLSQAVILC
jgi:hypothetical protein